MPREHTDASLEVGLPVGSARDGGTGPGSLGKVRDETTG